ncbi:hypothetical protein [Nocardia wallacei]|uniref:hypothetical protein n=1 Tax=Nocardia wallacei TaxID=480035 RepID=UPI002457C69B|nr:hypothetical protein [Nocardia wallacei]
MTRTWPQLASHIAAMAQRAGLCLRPRDAQPFGWQLLDGRREVAHGTLEDLDRYLQGRRGDA